MLVVTEAVQERREEHVVIMTATFISNLLLKWQLGHILGRGAKKILDTKVKRDFQGLGVDFIRGAATNSDKEIT